jgi:hypothetical protein
MVSSISSADFEPLLAGSRPSLPPITVPNRHSLSTVLCSWHSSYSVGKGVSLFKAGILENTSAMKSMNPTARVGSNRLAT